MVEPKFKMGQPVIFKKRKLWVVTSMETGDGNILYSLRDIYEHKKTHFAREDQLTHCGE